MGVPVNYGKIQLKIGEPKSREKYLYNIGEEVDIPDGIYLASNGAIVVLEGRLICEFDGTKLFDKYGKRLATTLKNTLTHSID